MLPPPRGSVNRNPRHTWTDAVRSGILAPGGVTAGTMLDLSKTPRYNPSGIKEASQRDGPSPCGMQEPEGNSARKITLIFLGRKVGP